MSTRVTLDELQQMVGTYRKFLDGLRGCLVGRDEAIDQVARAILTRQHVMTFGPPGTGKTLLFRVVAGSIEGMKFFSHEVSQFDTIDAVFGPPNIKLLRLKGEFEHNTAGMLPEADFAHLGEFLDGSQPFLRSLLRALNERELARGKQIIGLPLRSAFCDTNKDPVEVLRKNEYLWALLDRIMYFQKVDYIESDQQAVEMVRRFQERRYATNGNHVSKELIDRLSELIVCPPNLFRDEVILIKLTEAMMEYRRQRRALLQSQQGIKTLFPEITDRRIALASELPETEAVLAGRLRVEPEDIMNVGLVIATSPDERQLWNGIARKTIEEIKDIRGQQVGVVQNQFLVNLDHQLETLAADVSSTTVPVSDSVGLLKELERQLIELRPEDDAATEGKAKATARLAGIRKKLRSRIMSEAGMA